jgi:flagellar basal body-associated protein FliL
MLIPLIVGLVCLALGAAISYFYLQSRTTTNVAATRADATACCGSAGTAKEIILEAKDEAHKFALGPNRT